MAHVFWNFWPKMCEECENKYKLEPKIFLDDKNFDEELTLTSILPYKT